MSVLRSKFFWKLYLTYSGLFLAVTGIVSWLATHRVQDILLDDVESSLTEKALLLEGVARKAFAESAADDLKSRIAEFAKVTKTRVTIIEDGGQVIADSGGPASYFDNHWDRPEVKDALRFGEGMSRRASDSIQLPLVYFAKKIVDESGKTLGVVRVALPLAEIDQELRTMRLTIYGVGFFGIVLALLVGLILVRRVTEPITQMMQVCEAMRQGDYTHKVKTLPADEIGRLGDTLNRLGEEITRQIDEVRRLERVRRDFVANVSHEIKTPLTTIRGYTETLLEGALEDPVNRVRFLEKIQANASRLTTLVRDILSLAQIESAHFEIKREPVDCHRIVKQVLSEHEDAIRIKRLTVEVDSSSAPVIAEGDGEAMHQVVGNLVTNAIRYTHEGGRISISLKREKGQCVLMVEDSGIGIETEHLGRIFERFYRVDTARSRSEGGTGLGLSIVKHLVQHMGGQVTVESEVGVGSRFIVRLQTAQD